MVMENRVPTYSTLVDFIGLEHLNISTVISFKRTFRAEKYGAIHDLTFWQ